MTTQRASQAALSYDAVSILGFGPESPEALPEANPGEIVIRYGGWSLRELRDAMAPRGLMQDEDWYEECQWASEQLPSGIYVLRLPIPGSNRKTFPRQKALLLPGEEPAPVVLAASTILSTRVSGNENPLNSIFTRCKERTDDGKRVELFWYLRQLVVGNCWNDAKYVNVWLSSARKID